MIRNDREYRNFDLAEFREDNKYIFEGYASTFEPYQMAEMDGEKFFERIDPHAFDDADMADVVFLLDHTGRVYARTKNDTVQWTREAFSREQTCPRRRRRDLLLKT